MKSDPVKKILILSFSALCIANYVAALFWHHSGEGKSFGAKLEGIRWTTGTWQRWNMFHSIPIIHRLDYKIVARDEAGKASEFGMELPGLEKVEMRESIRYFYTLIRMFETAPDFRDAYIAAVAAELGEKDPALREFTIVSESGKTRHLFHLRRDAANRNAEPRMSELETKVFGPYPIGDE